MERTLPTTGSITFKGQFQLIIRSRLYVFTGKYEIADTKSIESETISLQFDYLISLSDHNFVIHPTDIEKLEPLLDRLGHPAQFEIRIISAVGYITELIAEGEFSDPYQTTDVNTPDDHPSSGYERSHDKGRNGTFTWNSKTNGVTAAGDLNGILGLSDDSGNLTMDQILDHVHPGDGELFKQKLLLVLQQPSVLQFYYRLRKENPSTGYIHQTLASRITDGVMMVTGIVREVLSPSHSLILHSNPQYILDMMNEACFQLDGNGTIVFANKKVTELTHQSLEDMIGRNICEVFPDASASLCHEVIHVNALDKKQYSRYEYFYEAIKQWISLSATPTDHGCIVTFYEIDDVKQAHAKDRIAEIHESRLEIKHQKDRLQDILDAIPQIIWVLDANGKITFVNERSYIYTGLTQERSIDQDPRELNILHPGQQKEIIDRWIVALEHGVPFSGEMLVKNSTGEYRWNLNLTVPIRNARGNVSMWVCTLTDVHEQFLSEKRLIESRNLLDAVFNSSTNYVATLEREAEEAGAPLRWKLYNNRMAELIGNKDLHGIEVDLADLPGGAQLLRKIEEVMATGEMQDFEQQISFKDLSYWFHIVAVKLEDCVVVTLTDVTDMVKSRQNVVQLNTRLKRKNQELKEMNDELTNFSFVASHDLREPLRKIKLFCNEILERENANLTDKGKDYLSRMAASVTRMNTLIDDVSSFATMSSSTEQQLEQVDLNDVVEKVIAELSERVQESQARIVTSNLQTIPGNTNQIFQLIENLVSNAIKFHLPDQAPEIVITGETTSGREVDSPLSDPAKSYYKLEVRDNGIGFDEQYTEKIFQMFQRLHVRTIYPGTGIGLAICKKIMERHNGFIIANSKPGQGSSFKCYFML